MEGKTAIGSCCNDPEEQRKLEGLLVENGSCKRPVDGDGGRDAIGDNPIENGSIDVPSPAV